MVSDAAGPQSRDRPLFLQRRQDSTRRNFPIATISRTPRKSMHCYSKLIDSEPRRAISRERWMRRVVIGGGHRRIHLLSAVHDSLPDAERCPDETIHYIADRKGRS